MITHKKILASYALIFIGMMGFATLTADAATTGREIQDLRYCTINNIYKVPQGDCTLCQDRFLIGSDQIDTVKKMTTKSQDDAEQEQSIGPRIIDCPNYEGRQVQITPDTSTASASETTNYGSQPQDGTGEQYGQQSKGNGATHGLRDNSGAGRQHGGNAGYCY